MIPYCLTWFRMTAECTCRRGSDSASEAYLEPNQISMMELFCENS